MKEIEKTLLKIQKGLKAPKSQHNSFGKYNYRNCEDILEALKPLLEGCTLTITDEVVMIGTRYYVKASASLWVGDESICVSSYAREDETKKGMDVSQITGAASSYARKYALNGLFLIDDTKDADSDKHEDKPIEKPVAWKTSDISALLELSPEDRAKAFWKWMGDMGKTKVEELSQNELKAAYNALTKKGTKNV